MGDGAYGGWVWKHILKSREGKKRAVIIEIVTTVVQLNECSIFEKQRR